MEKDDLPPRPPLTFEIGERKIKMTYGMEMDIRRMLPDPVTALQLMQNDPFTQDYVIRRVLTDKAKIITNEEDLIAFEDVDLEPDEVEALLGWAMEHALYFFMKRTSSLSALGSTYMKTPMDPSLLTTGGSKNSPSSTPSAGPSE